MWKAEPSGLIIISDGAMKRGCCVVVMVLCEIVLLGN